MKKLFLWCILLLLCTLTKIFSQEESTNINYLDIKKDTLITKRVGYFSVGYNAIFSQGKPSNNINIQYEYLLSKHFSLNYSIGMSMGSKKTSFHTTLGTAGAFYLIKSLSEDDSNNNEDCCEYCDDDDPDKCQEDISGYAAFALLLLIPEGFTIYTNPDQLISPSFYFNILSYETIVDDDEEFRITPSLGFKLLFKLNERVFFEPQVGLKFNMPNSDMGFIFGIGLKF